MTQDHAQSLKVCHLGQGVIELELEREKTR